MKLKPAGKIVLFLMFAGIVAAGYLTLGKKFGLPGTTEPAVAAQTPTSPAAPAVPVAAPNTGGAPVAAAVPAPVNVGERRNLKVALSQWPGHMAGVIACGGLTTQPGSLCERLGLAVEFVFIETPDEKNTALQSGAVDAVWQTVDEMPLNNLGYAKAGVPAQAFVQIDWSRGGDACVASPAVKRPEDLLNRKAAMMKFTPDHTLYEFWITNSTLTPQQIAQVRANTTFSMDSWEYGRELFCAGQVDVACLWEPDVTLALQCRQGAHRVFSTKDATTLVADVLLARTDFLTKQPDMAEKLARAFIEGAKFGGANLDAAARLVSTHVPRFRDELKYAGTRKAFDWVRWNDLGDQVPFFGLDGTKPKFDVVYEQADTIWSEYKETDGSPVLSQRFSPHTLRTDAIVRRIYEAEKAQGQQVVVEQPVYNPSVAASAAPTLVKPVALYFDTGRSDLDPGARSILKRDVLAQLALAEGMYVRVEGNTDDVGNDTVNQQLSLRRAQSVVDFLVTQGVAQTRIASKGNGEANPMCNLKTEDCRAQNRRTDIVFISGTSN